MRKKQSSGFLTRSDTETALACKFAFNLISRRCKEDFTRIELPPEALVHSHSGCDCKH